MRGLKRRCGDVVDWIRFIVSRASTRRCLSKRLAHSVGSGTDVNVWLHICGLLVSFAYSQLERFNVIGTDQINGAAAKPTAHHACSVYALGLHSELHHKVEFPATYFKIVAQARMRLTHQITKGLQIFLLQCGGGFEDADGFLDDVTAPGQNRLWPL